MAAKKSVNHSWAGNWIVDSAADVGSKPGGANVIWTPNAGAACEFSLTPKPGTGFWGLEVYECRVVANMPSHWNGCLFFKIGNKELSKPKLRDGKGKRRIDPWKHPYAQTYRPYDSADSARYNKYYAPILNEAEGVWTANPKIERLMGSIVVQDPNTGPQVEILFLYRIRKIVKVAEMGKKNVKRSKLKDLLMIKLIDPSTLGGGKREGGTAQAREH